LKVIDWLIVHCLIAAFASLLLVLDARNQQIDRPSSILVGIGALFLVVSSLLVGIVLLSIKSWEWLLVSVIPLVAACWVLRRRLGELYNLLKS